MLRKGIYNLLGQLIRISISLISIPILINFMGLELYGLWSWSTTILTVSQLSEGGMSAGFLHYLSRNHSSRLEINILLTSCIVLLIISITVLFIIIIFISPHLLSSVENISESQKSELLIVLYVGAFLVVQRIIQSLFWAILQSNQQYGLYNILSSVQVILTNISWMILAYKQSSYLPNYIYIGIIVTFFFTIILLAITRSYFNKFQWFFDSKNFKQLSKYNMGAWGSSLGSAIFTQGDKLIIADVLGPAPLAIYVVFTSICTQLNVLTAQVIHPVFPTVSSFINSKSTDRREFIQSIDNLFLMNVYLSLGGMAALVTFSPEILTFFLDENFTDVYIVYFCYLALIYGLYTLSVTGNYILLGQGKSNRVMQITLFSGSIVLVAVYLLSSAYGLIGAVWGNVFYLLILILLFKGMNYIYTSIRGWIFLVLKPMFIVLVFFVLLVIIQPILLLRITTFILLAIILLYSFFKRYLSPTYR